jgi:hypothetical protein
VPNDSETDLFVDQDRRTGTRSILSVPLIGWVPKARDFTCGFSVVVAVTMGLSAGRALSPPSTGSIPEEALCPL